MTIQNDIPLFIRRLLPSDGCVVIPGLGGFITHKQPAQIIEAQNRMLPPRATVAFNPALRANDGLLASALSVRYGFPYSQAMDRLQEYTWWCISELNNGKVLTFNGLGALRLDDLKNFHFEPEEAANFLDDAFGLAPVIAAPIRRHKKTLAAADNRIDRKPRRQKSRTVLEGLKWTAMVLPILLMAIYSVIQTGVLEGYVNYSAFVGPFAQQIENVALTEKSGDGEDEMAMMPIRPGKFMDEPVQEEERLPDYGNISEKTYASSPAQGTDNNEESEPEKVTPEPVASKTGLYHLIAGCFRNVDNAHTLMGDLSQKGFDASLAGISSNGLTRVSVASYGTESEAVAAIQGIKSRLGIDVWVLKL
jgi:hypothetical protein